MKEKIKNVVKSIKNFFTNAKTIKVIFYVIAGLFIAGACTCAVFEAISKDLPTWLAILLAVLTIVLLVVGTLIAVLVSVKKDNKLIINVGTKGASIDEAKGFAERAVKVFTEKGYDVVVIPDNNLDKNSIKINRR